MTAFFGEQTSTARRAWKRPCDLCGDPILRGDEVRRYCVRDAGDFAALVEHATCSRLAHELWGYEEWPCTRWPLRDDDEAFAAARDRLAAARKWIA